MVEAVGAFGDAVMSGMAARTVEPAAGEGDGHSRGGHCLNCHTSLVGAFCHDCGQQGHVHRTLSAFGHDIAHSVLHFEGKFWRTLPLLAWRPGELTRRYVEGERARFLSPMALFLFSVFVMFAVFGTLGDRAYRDQRPQSAAAPVPSGKAAPAATAAPKARPKAATGPVQTDLIEKSALEWLNKPYREAKKNPKLMLYKLQSNAYKFSWALIPISVPFLWLLFLHRRRYRQRYKAYDHLVFVTYSISFMSMGAIGLTLLKLTGLNGAPALLPALIVPIHMYRQLRGAYELSRPSALWRAFLLSFFALVAGMLYAFLLIIVGVFG